MDTAKQMEMAFMMEEGGLTDDGATVDPVSGNEVPPGSLAEEVRDDIPAQLSEGEYVVPADVVRFYGVKFFEDLREEAKRGMMEMEANGRIGGEPVEMSEGDVGDLTPEEVAALEQVTGMAMGGSVQADPYLQPAPQAVGNTVGYAEGGTVDPNAPQFTQATGMSFAPGFLAQTTAPTPGITVVTLYGPNGEVRTLSLPAQQTEYDTLIQQGYTQTPVATTTATTVGAPSSGVAPSVAPAVTSGESGYSRRLDDIGQQSQALAPAPIEVSKIKSEDLEKTARGLSTMANIAAGLAGAIGAPISALVNTGAVARYNDIVERMESEGIKTDLERRGSIFGGEATLYGGLRDFSDQVEGNKKGTDFGDTWLGDLLGFDGQSGIQAKDDEGNLLTLKRSWAGDRRDQEYKAPEETETAEAPAVEEEPKNAALEAVKARGIGASRSEQARLNAIASQARAVAPKDLVTAYRKAGSALPPEMQKAVDEANAAGLGWMYT
jgi:hypothetical protein